MGRRAPLQPIRKYDKYQVATRFPRVCLTEVRGPAKTKLKLGNFALAPGLQRGYLVPKFQPKFVFQEQPPWPALPSKIASIRFPTGSTWCCWPVIGRE